MTEPVAASPLAHREPLTAERVSVSETAFLGMLSLRGRPATIGEQAASALGAPLPSAVGETAVAGNITALWLGPDDWLLVTPPGNEAALGTKLSDALTGTHHQLTDVSDYYTAIDVTGAAARDVMSKLMVIDLHPRALKPGMIVATVCAKANVWLHVTGSADRPVLRLIVRRSHADYLWCLIAESGREFGLPPQLPVGRVKLHLPHFE
ncbi:sarcosine oxidase subunit gamma [Cucumibacter marinus]|uniref:sarcosine oxidase subunit gamma n=1 Tax=Cucumibacter marinus TaxID=1121252 RepID=UPI000415D3C3|nr:sarcosine oxidase subunit gamma family protein [Cucumibacter marinus]